MTHAIIYEALRTPRGRSKKGSLTSVTPLDLVTGLARELEDRHPELDPQVIDDLILGVVTPVNDQGGDIAKAAALQAGWPETVSGVQLNRFCGSGLEAVNQAAARVRSGFEQLIIAGGVESMSRAPLGTDGGPLFNHPRTTYDQYFVPQGIGADLIASIEGFSRTDVDAFAVASQERAEAAWASGAFDRSVVPVRDRNGLTILARDEHRRPGTTVDSLAGLPPAFADVGRVAGFDAVALQKYHSIERIDHVHHGGNSSGIVDGAALTVIGSEEIGAKLGMRPRARIIATAVSGADPTIMLTGPRPATEKALRAANLTLSEIDLFELNEAFASVVLKWKRDLALPDDRVNVNGGAIAMGHPLGATGAMLVGTVLDELERRDLKRGLITLCIGGGMGVAQIIERV